MCILALMLIPLLILQAKLTVIFNTWLAPVSPVTVDARALACLPFLLSWPSRCKLWAGQLADSCHVCCRG
jgi:hypothetical protein